MITRIRIEAMGRTADEVERTLYPHGDLIEQLLNIAVGRGECVIERDQREPEGRTAWKGRLNLYPDTSENPLTLKEHLGLIAGVSTTVELPDQNVTLVGVRLPYPGEYADPQPAGVDVAADRA